MKNKIKKSIVVLGVTLTVLCSSMSVFAASCLDVRDYGYHRYNERTEIQESRVATGGTDKGIKVRVTTTTRKWCVCGAQKVETSIDYIYIK